MKSFTFILEQFVNKKKPLIAAVSGGADSMALLHMLYENGYKKIIVAHLNHQLRNQARKDEKLVEVTAKKYGYTFEKISIDIKKLAQKNKRGIEETGRMERYEFFNKLSKKYKAAHIVTAHNKNDHVETMLLNLIRGAGLQGLCGLQILSKNIIRPLLELSKKDIYNYCKKHKIRFVEDKSNKNTLYTRNYVRHKLIPIMEKINGNLVETLSVTSEIFKDAQQYLLQRAEIFLKKKTSNGYPLERFKQEPKVIQNETIRKLYFVHHGNLIDFTSSHLEQILKILNQNTGGKQKEFGRGLIIKTNRGFFKVIKKR